MMYSSSSQGVGRLFLLMYVHKPPSHFFLQVFPYITTSSSYHIFCGSTFLGMLLVVVLGKAFMAAKCNGFVNPCATSSKDVKDS